MATFQETVISPPILALPYTGGHYMLDTDACSAQVGCVLIQEQPNPSKGLTSYWSRSLTKAKQAYDTTQKECLEVVWSLLFLRPYLKRTQITIRTAHHSLR